MRHFRERVLPIFAFTGSLTRPAPNYREANGRGVTSLRFDEISGRLRPMRERGDIDDASWLAIDRPRRRLYAICEVDGTDQSWVIAFQIEADGRLTELNRQPTGGQTACHASLAPDGRLLLVANYSAVVPAGAPDGSVASFPLTDAGLGARSGFARHAGSGPNPVRQERAHAHCVVPSPDGRFAYVADLGLDRIVVYAVGADGSLTPQRGSDFSFPPGTGPRHLVFDAPGRRLFAVSELIPAVFSFAVDAATGALALQDAFGIEQLGEAIVQPAGILLSADGRRLFADLRECNEILGLTIDAVSGKLSQTGRWPCGGATPRDFAFSPDGRYLLVANQDADRLTVFPVDDGRLGEPVQNLALGTPMAVALAEF
jgi:6-phosphogluconolactonase